MGRSGHAAGWRKSLLRLHVGWRQIACKPVFVDTVTGDIDGVRVDRAVQRGAVPRTPQQTVTIAIDVAELVQRQAEHLSRGSPPQPQCHRIGGRRHHRDHH